MTLSPGMSQELARSPGLVVSTVLTCMVGALLPPLPGLMLFVGGLALTIVLCAGGLERPAVRLLGRARVLSEVQAAALAPAIALLCQKGLGPPTVDLYARDGEVGISAGADPHLTIAGVEVDRRRAEALLAQERDRRCQGGSLHLA